MRPQEEIYIEYLKDKSIFKKVNEMTFEELKLSFNNRLVEKAQAHPESVFQKFWPLLKLIILTQWLCLAFPYIKY